MTGDLALGISAALAAAACYGVAPVVQAKAARAESTGTGVGAGLLVRLLRRPQWLLGFAGEVGGFVLEAYAFSATPATLVVPLLTFDVIVFAVLASRVFGEPISVRGAAGIAAIAVGAALLGLAFAGKVELGERASTVELLALLAGCAAVVGVTAIVGSRAAAAQRWTRAAGCFSTAAGVSYGVATIATRQVGRTFSIAEPWQLLASATPYVLAATSLLAIITLQRALQASPVVSFPVTTGLSAALPVILGAAVLHDPVPSGTARAGFVVGLVLIGAGIGLVAEDRVAMQARADTVSRQTTSAST